MILLPVPLHLIVLFWEDYSEADTVSSRGVRGLKAIVRKLPLSQRQRGIELTKRT